ncbi:MAG TPA: tetratricopeptide repeat protein [Anaeromyxobacter sp.]
MKKRLVWGALAVLLVATFAAYLPSMDGEFQYDDQEIAKTVWVRQAERFLDPSFWAMPRPLTSALYAVNHRMDGFRPRVWHVTSVLIHLAVVVLAWRFARRVLARAGVLAGPQVVAEPEAGKGKGRGKARRAVEAAARAFPEWPALVVAALFALHPIQTEAVSYISQRSESLASAFVLGGLLALLAFDEAQPGKRWRWLAAAIVLHVLGLSAKPMAAPMPALWLLAAAVLPLPAERGHGWWPRVARRLPAAAPLLLLSLAAAFTGVKQASGSGHAGFDLGFVSPLQYFATQLRALPTYLRLVLVPYGLNADWLFPFSRSLLEPRVLVGLALLAALVAATFVAFARWGEAEGDGPTAVRLATFGWLFFLGMLAPTTLVPLRDPFVEHRLYLATLGIAFALSGVVLLAIRRLAPARGWIVAGVVGVVAAAGLGAATASRNQVWQSALNLWKDASEKSPGKPRIWVNLGTALHFAGRYDEAVKAYDRSVALGFDPTVPLELVVRNTALALVRLRRYDEARARLETYLARAPRDAGTIVILALVQVDTGLLDDAERSARNALALDPAQSRPYQILGQVQEKRGDLQGALDAFATANRIDPADPLPVFSMGRIEEKRGRVDEACRLYFRATDALARSSAARSANEAYARLCARRAAPLR